MLRSSILTIAPCKRPVGGAQLGVHRLPHHHYGCVAAALFDGKSGSYAAVFLLKACKSTSCAPPTGRLHGAIVEALRCSAFGGYAAVIEIYYILSKQHWGAIFSARRIKTYPTRNNIKLKENALTQRALSIAPLQSSDYELFIVLSRHGYWRRYTRQIYSVYGLK